jgi:hypothetical protein
MEFPARAQAIVQALWAAHQDLANGTADQQRALTRMIAEQLAFELDPLWGCKKAGPTNPQGSSTLAYNDPAQLYIWRWSDGDGSVTRNPGSPLPRALLMPLDQSVGQIFIPVTPTDHLGLGPSPPAPSAPAPGPSGDYARVLERLNNLEQRLLPIADEWEMTQRDIGDLRTDVEVLRGRRYVANVGPFRIVSVPE